MAMNNPYAKYKNEAIFTASPEDLTLMLYDGALKFINQAIVAIESKDNTKANELLLKVQNIIREFQLTLNRDYEISDQFDALYAYMYERLIDANIKKDVEIAKEVRDLVREMRDTWREAIKLARQQTAASNSTAPVLN